jgi:hypothetical protein
MFNWKDISMAGIIILAIIFYTYKKHHSLVKTEPAKIKTTNRVSKLDYVADSTHVLRIKAQENRTQLSI